MMRNSPIRIWFIYAFTLALTGSHALGDEIELGKIYPATLDFSAEGIGRDWVCTKQDVWALTSFEYAVGEKFKVQLGPANVVFGHHGTDVVWAAVLPATPGKLLKAPAGEGASVTSIFLRFHPELVQQIFPPKTVTGQGPLDCLITARRLYQYKINAGWQSGNLPVIPMKHSITLDCETVKSKRQRFAHDARTDAVEHHAFVLNQVVPELSFSPEQAEQLYLDAWEAFDREYAMFVVKPKVNWAELRDDYLPLARKAKTHYEVAGAIALLVSHLEDLHVSVQVGQETLWCYSRHRPLNANWPATQSKFAGISQAGQAISWGKSRDNFGYLAVDKLPGKALAEEFDKVLEELKETRGLILDLRFNGGGDEPTAGLLAGRFVDQARVYSLNQYRSGPRHDQLGEKLKRTFNPRGPWRYEKPVIILIGQKTMSSAESFALMMAQCPQVTTMGDRTAGSSANPRLLNLAGQITVRLPRWLDMDPEGKPIDFVGVQPDIKVAAKASEFTNTNDPVINAALKNLRER